MQAATFTPRTTLACAPKVARGRTRRARTHAVACRASSSSNDDVVGTFSIGDRCRALAASTLVVASGFSLATEAKKASIMFSLWIASLVDMPHNLNMPVFTINYAIDLPFVEPIALGQRMHEW